MKNITDLLEQKGHSIRALSEQWGLHRKTVRRICEGTILRDTDHLFRYFFCQNAGIADDDIQRECLSRFQCVAEGPENRAAEARFYSLRQEVCTLLTMVQFDSEVAGHIMVIGKQLDALAQQLGIAKVEGEAHPVGAKRRAKAL